MEWLKGKKTYIVMIVGVLLNGAVVMELIDPQYIVVINTVLGFLGLGAIRAGIK